MILLPWNLVLIVIVIKENLVYKIFLASMQWEGRNYYSIIQNQGDAPEKKMPGHKPRTACQLSQYHVLLPGHVLPSNKALLGNTPQMSPLDFNICLKKWF